MQFFTRHNYFWNSGCKLQQFVCIFNCFNKTYNVCYPHRYIAILMLDVPFPSPQRPRILVQVCFICFKLRLYCKMKLKKFYFFLLLYMSFWHVNSKADQGILAPLEHSPGTYIVACITCIGCNSEQTLSRSAFFLMKESKN